MSKLDLNTEITNLLRRKENLGITITFDVYTSKANKKKYVY